MWMDLQDGESLGTAVKGWTYRLAIQEIYAENRD